MFARAVSPSCATGFQRWLAVSALAVALQFTLAQPSVAQAPTSEEIWNELANEIFKGRPLADGTGTYTESVTVVGDPFRGTSSNVAVQQALIVPLPFTDKGLHGAYGLGDDAFHGQHHGLDRLAWQGRQQEWPRSNWPNRCLSFAASLNKDLCALGLESEAHFRQSSLAHGITQASLIFGVEHEETTSAGAD